MHVLVYIYYFLIFFCTVNSHVIHGYVTEDDRVYISELMYDLLASRKENTRSSFVEVCLFVHNAVNL